MSTHDPYPNPTPHADTHVKRVCVWCERSLQPDERACTAQERATCRPDKRKAAPGV